MTVNKTANNLFTQDDSATMQE